MPIYKLILLRTFGSMIRRCYRKNNSSYPYYGARGIKICEEWLNDRSKFIDWALSNGWKRNLSIDRISNDQDYSPRNCRWATTKEQGINRRKTVIVNYKGERVALAQLAHEANLTTTVVLGRVRRGWSIEDALTRPVKSPRSKYEVYYRKLTIAN